LGSSGMARGGRRLGTVEAFDGCQAPATPAMTWTELWLREAIDVVARTGVKTMEESDGVHSSFGGCFDVGTR
jgi:hypothetical protein